MVGGDAASINVRNLFVKSVAPLAVVGALGAITLSSVSPPPWIVWNASHSVPIGLYRVQLVAPHRHDLALVRLAPDFADLAKQRGYLHSTDYVLKPVLASAGDKVCRRATAIVFRGDVAALAQLRDVANRPMPAWHGCHTLKPGDLFLLSTPPDSFDSRYFGPVAGTQVIGSAQPLWTFPNTSE